MGQWQSIDLRIHSRHLRPLGVCPHGRDADSVRTNLCPRGTLDSRDYDLKMGLRVLSGDNDAST